MNESSDQGRSPENHNNKQTRLLELIDTLLALTGSLPATVIKVRSQVNDLLAGSGVEIAENSEAKILELKKLAVRIAVDEVQDLGQQLYFDLPDELDVPSTDRGKELHRKIDEINAIMAVIPEFKTGFST